MDIIYNGKPIIPTKQALTELSEINLNVYDVTGILEKGFAIRKRKKEIIERGIQKGSKIINVVVVDMGGYYKLVHAGEFTLTKKFRAIIRRKNGV